MNFDPQHGIPGILRHSVQSNVPSEQAITITGYHPVKNPDSTVVPNISAGGGGFRTINFQFLNQENLNNAVVRAKQEFSVIKMRQEQSNQGLTDTERALKYEMLQKIYTQDRPSSAEASKFSLPLTEPEEETFYVEEAQDSRPRGRPSTAHPDSQASVRAKSLEKINQRHYTIIKRSILQLTTKIPILNNNTKTLLNEAKFLSDSYDKTGIEQGVSDFKTMLSKYNARARQIRGHIWTIRNFNANAGVKKLKEIVKLLEFVCVTLPEWVVLKFLQTYSSLCWEDLKKTFLNPLPLEEIRNILEELPTNGSEENLAEGLEEILVHLGKISLMEPKFKSKNEERRLRNENEVKSVLSAIRSGIDMQKGRISTRSRTSVAAGRASMARRSVSPAKRVTLKKRPLVVRKTKAQKAREKMTGGSTVKSSSTARLWVENQAFEEGDENLVLEQEYDSPLEDTEVEIKPVVQAKNKQKIKSKAKIQPNATEKLRLAAAPQQPQLDPHKQRQLAKYTTELDAILAKIQTIQTRYDQMQAAENQLQKEVDLELKNYEIDNKFRVVVQKKPKIGTKILTGKMTKNMAARKERFEQAAEAELGKIEKNLQAVSLDETAPEVVTFTAQAGNFESQGQKPEKITLFLDPATHSEIDDYRQKMQIYKNNSKYKNNITSTEKILKNKNLKSFEEPDPFTSLEKLAADTIQKIMLENDQKLDQMLDLIAERMIDDEFHGTGSENYNLEATLISSFYENSEGMDGRMDDPSVTASVILAAHSLDESSILDVLNQAPSAEEIHPVFIKNQKSEHSSAQMNSTLRNSVQKENLSFDNTSDVSSIHAFQPLQAEVTQNLGGTTRGQNVTAPVLKVAPKFDHSVTLSGKVGESVDSVQEIMTVSMVSEASKASSVKNLDEHSSVSTIESENVEEISIIQAENKADEQVEDVIEDGVEHELGTQTLASEETVSNSLLSETLSAAAPQPVARNVVYDSEISSTQKLETTETSSIPENIEMTLQANYNDDFSD